MFRIIWKKAFEVNHPQIDAQHIHLVDIINQMCDIINAGKKAPLQKDNLILLLDQLDEYVKVHFSTEESLFSDTSFNAQTHIQLHREFEARLEESKHFIQQEYDLVKITELYDSLFQWFVEHIIDEDQKYTTYIK